MHKPAMPALVVDLDGTLTPTDTLIESVVQLAREKPWLLPCLLVWVFLGRAGLKEKIAGHVTFDARSLPWNEPLLAYLREQKAQGRTLVLATAAHDSIAQAVARELPIFDHVIATRNGVNNKSGNKLEAIGQLVGPDFVYAGDSRADLPIWQAARAAIVAGRATGLARRVGTMTPLEKIFPTEPSRWQDWLRLLRLHHWAKNLLLFVPLLTSFRFHEHLAVTRSLYAFIAFGLLASATYILNDIWDIQNDREHPRKRERALARCAIPIPQALAVAALLFVAALCIGSAISLPFLGTLLAYLFITTLYSFHFKKIAITDVMLLSLLFTMRIFAGATAIDVQLSSWLMAFSVFIFFSLALVKRCAELVTLDKINKTQTTGRGYHVNDQIALTAIGIASGLSAVVILGLFIASPETQSRYSHPHILWGIGIVLIHWISSIWLATTRGQMEDDPLVYSLKDRASQVSIVAMVVLTLLAK